MKKVSFIKGYYYVNEVVRILPENILALFIDEEGPEGEDYLCTESFTAEITVKIVPYEQQ